MTHCAAVATHESQVIRVPDEASSPSRRETTPNVESVETIKT